MLALPSFPEQMTYSWFRKEIISLLIPRFQEILAEGNLQEGDVSKQLTVKVLQELQDLKLDDQLSGVVQRSKGSYELALRAHNFHNQRVVIRPLPPKDYKVTPEEAEFGLYCLPDGSFTDNYDYAVGEILRVAEELKSHLKMGLGGLPDPEEKNGTISLFDNERNYYKVPLKIATIFLNLLKNQD